MNSEQQQQRIMSYFIEEAQEHLQTIEQGVLDLQAVLADVERINELFRAAHSIKGGAAMLDLGSIQHISHRLEDYFKILKDNVGVEVDEKLKSLFLAGCDRLQELLNYLQENYTIAQDLATAKVAEVEPVFADLELHLNSLVTAAATQAEDTLMREQRTERLAYDGLMAEFQGSVAGELRNILQLFKQEDTQTTRLQLQDVCDRLSMLGENIGGNNWQALISTSKLAISNLTNPYLTLAQAIVRDIRQAQDLVLAERSQEISISEQLQALSSHEAIAADRYVDEFSEDRGSIASEIEEDEFLYELGTEGTELTEEFNPELFESDDLGNELEGSDRDSNFDWNAVESDIDTGENYDLERELDAIETGDNYNLDINNAIDDFEATSNLDDEFDFNDGLTDEEAFEPDLEDIQSISVEDSAIDISLGQEFEAIEDIGTTYFSDPSVDSEIDTFDMTSSSDDDFDLGDRNEFEESEDSDDVDPFAATSSDEGQKDFAPQDVEPLAVSDELGDLDGGLASEELIFTDSFSDSSLDEDLINSESLDLLDDNLNYHSEPEPFEADVISVFDRTEEIFAEKQEDLQSFDPNEEEVADRTTALDDEITDVGSTLSEVTEFGTMEPESSLLENVPDFAEAALPLAELEEKADDDLSEVFAVDRLFDLEALGFDLNDSEEDEDNFVLQGIAASDLMYSVSSTEASDLTQTQQETPDSNLGMSDFFSEEANELLTPIIESEAEIEEIGVSVSSDEIPVTQQDLRDDFLQFEDLDLDENMFSLDTTSVVTDAGTDSSPGMNLDDISGERNDLDFQLNQVADYETPDLSADRGPDESALRSDSPLDDVNETKEEVEDFLDLFASAETAEFANVEHDKEQLSFTAISQQETMPPLDDDASVLEDLMLHETETAGASDVDLDNLFSDSDDSQGSDMSENRENVGEEVLTFESLDISQDIGQDTNFADFNELLDLGFDANDSTPVEGIQVASQEELNESDEPSSSVNTEEQIGLVRSTVDEATVSDSDTPDEFISEHISFAGEDDTITAFIDEIEDLVEHHSDLVDSTVTTPPPQLDDASSTRSNFHESDTVLQANDEISEINDSFHELVTQSDDRNLHESAILEDRSENVSIDESTTPINATLPDIIPDDVGQLAWEDLSEDITIEHTPQLPLEDFTKESVNEFLSEVQTGGSSSEDDSQLEEMLAQVNLAERQSLDEMIPEASLSDSGGQEFTDNSDFNKDFEGFNTSDFSDLSDPSDLDDEFSSILGFIEKEPDLASKTDEFSEIFGLTDLDFPESDSESDEGDGGVQKPKDKQPNPTNPINDPEPTSGDRGEDRTGSHDRTSDPLSDRSEITESTLDEINRLGNKFASTGNVTSSLAGENLTTKEPEDNSDGLEIFDELEALLTSPAATLSTMSGQLVATKLTQSSLPSEGDFADLEALLASPASKSQPLPSTNKTSKTKRAETDEFDELEMLLRDTYGKDVGPVNTKTVKRQALAKRAVTKIVSQTMKVDVKHLDSLNNLVGELVVNRNLLEQDQEKLQQFIGNLLFKVQQLGDVAQRMRDQYDRSLLENSIVASRPKTYASAAMVVGYPDSNRSAAVTESFEDIEFDRYNSFHILSQEILELVVRVRESASDIEFVVDETEQVSRQLGTITTQVQEDLKQVRMVPFAQIADRLPRAVRDLSFKTGKQADIEMHGRETLIDKAILEQLYDPMTHLVNNAIVHGLEDPATRQAAGKPVLGKIVVRAFHQGNQTVISISDDGAGINTAKVKESAVNKGLYTQSEVDQLSDLEAYDLLFEAGFSTKSQADELAGRGVGLDVVRTAINDIRGSVHTDSSVGKGTTFTIRLPLTLSISKAMFCISDRARIAFPVDGFEDVIEISQAQVQLNSKGQPCFPWRDTILPFQPLGNLLGYNRHIYRGNIYGKQDDDAISVIILRSEGNYLALQVDQFLGENEIVIKQLEGPIPKPAGIAGATILGDGKVMAIANVLELFDIAAGRLRPSITSVPMQPVEDEQLANEPTVLIVDDSITVRELLSLTFSKIGYRVEQARDGQDAWEKLRAGLPCNLIFCDIEMPRMDGLELLSRLQKDEFLSQIPVAMLTSRGADRHRQTASQLGAKGYFTKPYLEEEVLSGSQRMLRGEVLI